jgi:hypothetical protein
MVVVCILDRFGGECTGAEAERSAAAFVGAGDVAALECLRERGKGSGSFDPRKLRLALGHATVSLSAPHIEAGMIPN